MKYLVKSINNFQADEINDFYYKIPEIKRNKIKKLKNNIARTRSIIGELLLSELIHEEGLNYSDIDYYINEYGKPYFKNNDLYFNISHSFEYVISIISDKEVGIDIEKIRNTSIKTINQFATENEKMYILSTNTNVEERLFKIYTLKEAYFKMFGINLNEALQVEFRIENDKVYCSDNKVNVGFINDIDGYIIAYCKLIK